MKAEILCIGSELLLGDIVNTNAAYISERLSEIGINCFYHSAVGDNPDRIKQSLKISLDRSDLIIITGGLGPTDDDITMQGVSEFFGKELVFHEESYKKIEKFFAQRNLEVVAKSKKQAYFPEGAEVVPNPIGTAPGIYWKVEGKHIMTFPGVPDELYAMWNYASEKYLKKHSEFVIKKKFLRFFGIPEGTLGEKIKDLMTSQNPTVAPLVSEGQTNVRIAAKANSEDEAKILISDMEGKILSRIGDFYWGCEEQTFEEIVGNLLSEKGLTVSIAESCTGGLISSRLTDISGSSEYIKLNMITYANEAKIEQLGIDKEEIEQFGAVSEQVAKAMSEGIRKAANSDIGLGITGIAGPTGGTPEKPVGLVYVGISNKSKTEVYKINLNPNFPRKIIKHRASQYALNYLRLFLINEY